MIPNIGKVISRYPNLFLSGLGYTLLLSTITVFFGTVLGSLVALMRRSQMKLYYTYHFEIGTSIYRIAPGSFKQTRKGLKIKPGRVKINWGYDKVTPVRGFRVFSVIAASYTEIIRGTPLLLQLYFFVFLLPGIFPDLKLSNFTCVCIALVLNSAGYVSEVIRAGIQAVDNGQTEAARSLGLSSRQTMIHIVFPQAIKNILPALCNEFVTVIKETSLASTFFIGDLMTTYTTIKGAIYLVLEPLMVVGVIYFILTFTLSKAVAVLERRMKASD
jgi:His/Glu/Gln/Arg/opine family amino acid ABC transporter permease subunit